MSCAYQKHETTIRAGVTCKKIPYMRDLVCRWHIVQMLKYFLRARLLETVNSNRFEISNGFEKLFRLHDNFTAANIEILYCFQKLFRSHGDFTAATFQTIDSIAHVEMISFN